MFNWFKKQALVREGLSCGKERATSDLPGWKQAMENNGLVRLVILGLVLAAIVRIGHWHGTMPTVEIVTLGVLALIIAMVVVKLAAREVWQNNYLLLLMFLCTVTNLLLNKVLVVYSDQLIVFEKSIPALLVPSAVAPMLITILISPSAGFVTAFLVPLLGSLYLAPGPELSLSSLLTGFAAAYLTQRIRRRSDLLMAGVGVGLVGLGCALLIGWLHDPSLVFLVVQGVWAIALGVTTSILVGTALPVLEWLFDRITDISWLEMTDLNHPLLQRLKEEAPGTYHHSLNVANLAEAAAEAIGANPTQCRVSAYFHDIGKLVKPDYFVENYRGEGDPHKLLNPSMSALIIISHVKEGVNLARKYRLRQPVIDVIQEHHGTSIVYYFYKRALQQKQDALEGGKILKLREEDVPEVTEASFRYPGPVPQCRESAILSLADALESASRSLKNPTTQRLESLVNDIVKARVEEGQLAASNLTFNELAIVTEAFIETLKNMLHARIEYPRDRKAREGPDYDARPAEKPPTASLPAAAAE
ncbi:MAG: HDIG domain-containing protein [Candidatus Methylacidiphilales bacterium]|nr:HDIG domain-containing protein [Candidatus Methylacidiphilales bacterium]